MTRGERPTVRAAKVYLLQGRLTDGDVEQIKKYLINPVECREASLEKVESLQMNYDVPTAVATVEGFIDMDDAALAALLEKLGLTADALGFYDTPAYCFHDYIPVHRENLTLLICENKDIWFNLRRRMFENHVRNILGTRIDGVVYGCGNKVSEPEALTHYTDFLCASVTYLYWGDIDREGLNIYLRLVKNNPQLSVQLFVPAYTEMLHRAQMRTMPDSADHRERMEDYTSVYESFALCERDVFQEIICSNKRVPQEIISYADLEKYMSQE
jgi:hypothetical protein